MATRAQIQALIEQTQAALQSLGAASLETADGLAAATQAVAARDATIAAHLTRIGELEAALADCQDVEPDPDPDPDPEPGPAPPTGTIVKRDNCTQSVAWAIQNVFGQHSGVEPPKIDTFQTGGPFNGPRRVIRLDEGDAEDRAGDSNNERNELGRVNGDSGMVFKPGERHSITVWLRLPSVPFGTSSDNDRRNLMQFKHSGHTGLDEIHGIPPISFGQEAAGVYIKEKADNSNAEIVWRRSFPLNTWVQVALDILFNHPNGHINVWTRTETTPWAKVGNIDCPTSKPSKQGPIMPSTARIGPYQDRNTPARNMEYSDYVWQRLALNA